jgi:hypothetical protein
MFWLREDSVEVVNLPTPEPQSHSRQRRRPVHESNGSSNCAAELRGTPCRKGHRLSELSWIQRGSGHGCGFCTLTQGRAGFKTSISEHVNRTGPRSKNPGPTELLEAEMDSYEQEELSVYNYVLFCRRS